MFNKEQTEYIESLSKISPEKRCYCGWERFGKCYNCNRSEYRKGKTCADKLKEWCPECHIEPYNGKIRHAMCCSKYEKIK
jgi:hypothetical protein